MNKQLPLLAILAAAGSFCFLAGELNGQSPVRMPVDKASWKITVERPDAPKSPPPANPADAAIKPPGRKVKSISVDLNPPLRRDVIEWSDGSKSEVWLVGKLWLVETSQRVLVINHMGFGANYGDWHAFDESYFSWATEKSAKGVEDFKGKPALLYEGGHSLSAVALAPPPDAPAGAPAPKPAAARNKLWVDAESHLPLVLQEGPKSYVFTFAGAIAAPLVVPEKVQKEYERFTLLSQVPPPFRRSTERRK